MRLISLRFNDPQAGWQLEEMQFFPDVTLLVGLSGVGKTRILDTIKRLKRVAGGDSGSDLWGTTWELKFHQDDHEFTWCGEFESRDIEEHPQRYFGPFFDMADELQPKPKLLSELLTCDGQPLAKRHGDSIILNGQRTPKLSQEESLIHILRNEEGISQAHKGLEAILFVDHTEHSSRGFSFATQNVESLKRKLTSIEQIRSADIPTTLKLALAYENCPDTFQEIASQYTDAFPYVEELSIEFVEVGGPFGKVPRVFMREQGVEKPIPQEAISSGMLRTLLHLSRMALWPDGTVVLIDEFENSFGINCINFVTNDLMVQSHRLQFVLTSHHPYIINNIDKRYWKIVSRSGMLVKVLDSTLLAGDSSHEAFLQLLNLPEYAEGIVVE